MSVLPSLQALLLKARADATANTGDFAGAVVLYEQARRMHADSIEVDQLARLHFLMANWSALKALLPDLALARQGFWAGVLSAVAGETASFRGWDRRRPETDFDPVYLGYLMKAEGKVKEAQQAWLTYLADTQESWEHPFVGEALLALEPAQCLMCREAQASAYMNASPLCSTCHAWVCDEAAFTEALKNPTPEQARLIENITGEPYEPWDEEDEEQERPEYWTPPPETTYLELTELEALVAEMDAEALSYWNRSQELAGSEQPSPQHLWEALMEHPEGAYPFSRSEAEFAKLRRLTPTEPSLLWVLNLARWGAFLTPTPREESISPTSLFNALCWSLPGKSSVLVGMGACLAASQLSDAQRAEFERLLLERPSDPYIRVLLSHEDGNPTMALARLLWFIRHCPQQASAARGLEVPLGSPENQQVLVEAWCEAVSRQLDQVEVLSAAANYFRYKQPLLCAKLYQRGTELEPGEYEYYWQLMGALSSVAKGTKSKTESQRCLKEALQCAERALEHVTCQDGLYMILNQATGYAMRSGDWELVKRFAEKLLSAAEAADDWTTPVSTHRAHLSLGHASLHVNDVAKARQHLLDSVQADGPPEQDDFTPGVGLATKLLDHGERDVVLEYLNLCADFCEYGRDDLEHWVRTIQDGGTPSWTWSNPMP